MTVVDDLTASEPRVWSVADGRTVRPSTGISANMTQRHRREFTPLRTSSLRVARAWAINAEIQWIKRLACGYRNRERFRNAIYFHPGGLDLYPDALAAHTKS